MNCYGEPELKTVVAISEKCKKCGSKKWLPVVIHYAPVDEGIFLEALSSWVKSFCSECEPSKEKKYFPSRVKEETFIEDSMRVLKDKLAERLRYLETL